MPNFNSSHVHHCYPAPKFGPSLPGGGINEDNSAEKGKKHYPIPLLKFSDLINLSSLLNLFQNYFPSREAR